MVDWKPISKLFDFSKGTLQSSKCTPGKFNFITAAEDWKTHDAYTHDCEALVFAMAASGSLGRTHYVNGKFISSDLCFILTPKNGFKLDLIFYQRLFNFLRVDIVKKLATGTSKLAINQANFGAYKLPYFDYPHQLQFRGRIEKILALNNKFLAEIDMQLDFLPKLRQQILQDAIEGKLTADWRKKNPALITGGNHASKLLEKIKSEKSRLIQQGKLKKEKPLPPITEAEKPFPLPEGWIWCRLNEICSHITDIDHNMPQAVLDGVKFLSAKDLIDNGEINFTEGIKYISHADFKKLSRRIIPRRNDIIYSRIGARLGKARIVNSDETFLVSYSCCTIRTLAPDVKYINSILDSGVVLCQAGAQTTRNSIPDLGMDKIKNFIIPLPPLSEQKAITKKINDLVQSIDTMGEQVVERKNQSEMLMQSVLREAFENSPKYSKV